MSLWCFHCWVASIPYDWRSISYPFIVTRYSVKVPMHGFLWRFWHFFWIFISKEFILLIYFIYIALGYLEGSCVYSNVTEYLNDTWKEGGKYSLCDIGIGFVFHFHLQSNLLLFTPKAPHTLLLFRNGCCEILILYIILFVIYPMKDRLY